MNEPSITHSKGGGSTFAGREAVEVVRVAALMSSMGLYKVGLIPTRGFTGAKALKMATTYTGKKYKRGQYDEAKADLKVWIELMKSTIPTTIEQ